MTYALGGLIQANDHNTRLSIINNVWSTGSGSFGWGQPTLFIVNVGELVSVGQTSFNWDNFINNYRGSYSAVTYRAQAELVYPYYYSNDLYTITVPSTESRWGLYKYPDPGGLAYWTDGLLSASGGVVTVPDQNFTNQFFAAVDSIPGYTRDKTSSKSFDYGDPAEWASLVTTLNSISTHEVGSSAGITVPVTYDLITWINNFDSTMNTLCDVGGTQNRFGNFAVFDDQTVRTSSYSSTWGNPSNPQIQNVARIAWSNSNQARYFFNAGGRINLSISYSGGGSPQNTNWATVCSNAGTMWVQGNNSGGTASGGFGYWQSAGRMYSGSGSGAYSSNTLTVDVSGQGTNQMIFTTTFRDNHTNVWADSVSGTFTVTILVRRPPIRGLVNNTWGLATTTFSGTGWST